jgi:hypothetical protein
MDQTSTYPQSMGITAWSQHLQQFTPQLIPISMHTIVLTFTTLVPLHQKTL